MHVSINFFLAWSTLASPVLKSYSYTPDCRLFALHVFDMYQHMNIIISVTPIISLLMQNCQIDGDKGYIIGDAGTEELWINEDGDPFLYYTGSDNR